MDLSRLELELANKLRPLLDVHGDQSLYDKVLDQIVRGSGENKISDVENMRMIIDEVQVQLKSYCNKITDIQATFDNKFFDCFDKLMKVYHKERDAHGRGIILFAESVRHLLQDNINLMKLNVVGCKVKIYQERLRGVSFLEIAENYKD